MFETDYNLSDCHKQQSSTFQKEKGVHNEYKCIASET